MICNYIFKAKLNFFDENSFNWISAIREPHDILDNFSNPSYKLFFEFFFNREYLKNHRVSHEFNFFWPNHGFYLKIFQ